MLMHAAKSQRPRSPSILLLLLHGKQLHAQKQRHSTSLAFHYVLLRLGISAKLSRLISGV